MSALARPGYKRHSGDRVKNLLGAWLEAIKYIKSLHGLGAAFKSGTKNDLFVIEDIDTIAMKPHQSASKRALAPVWRQHL